ncbi:MAG: hypothetical protein QOK10_548 [Pseudonocardiales bacterium]|jgi:hypothetical protein|nr:hypothetical protein [Pseudonocardiales bacterium]
MVQVAERVAVPFAPARQSKSWLLDYGHLLLALIGSAAFMILKPPVADLQAADARAGAAARHVGLGYWLSWFGGSTPGQYSILTPALASVIGVTTLAALSVMLIAALARPLLSHTARPRSASYLVVISSLCNLFSGRVPFAVGLAVSLLGLFLLINGRPVLGGVVNGLATLFSPLGPSFILLALIGPAIARRDWRGQLARFAAPSVVGLVLPALLFGAPSPMPFAWTTLAWSVGIVAAALFLDLPKHLRVGLWAAAVVCLAAFLIPSGVGANISRYAFLLLPPIIWAVARNPRRVIALALLPAFVYSGYVVIHDVAAASRPAAQQTYYSGLRTKLLTLPSRNNYRVEVLDTATHRAAAELIPDVYLARGWETQSDSTNNALFYDPTLLNPTSYRNWLDSNAVAWVAVPTAPGSSYQTEANLIKTGLSYLTPVWSDSQWSLYQVARPQRIIPAPAKVIEANESQVVFDLAAPTTLTLRLRPAKFIHVINQNPKAAPVCLAASIRPGEIQATFPVAGRYVLTSSFAVMSSVKSAGGCRTQPTG